MPLQNRVDPYGRLLAVEARGTLMGNRGCLHDDHRRIRREWNGKRWILCLLQFGTRQRIVMTPRSYTELFFLDEVTGLAAGHRPCAECQRARFRGFQDAWARASTSPTGGALPSAMELDAVLHRERLDSERGKRCHEANLSDLPSGAMIVGEGGKHPFLVLGDALFPWSPHGYGQPVRRPARGSARVLTPPSAVGALRLGYAAGVHPSALVQ